jgi:ADP-ribosylation factor protein 6
MDIKTITKELELSKLEKRPWFVQPAIAIQGEGLTEGFGWLSDNIKNMAKK